MRTRHDKDRLQDFLQVSGVRLTRQRLALAAILFDGTFKHVTAEQVYAKARQAHMNVSLATVYNTLHRFTEAGLLREVSVTSERCYFDNNVSDHHHIYDDVTGELKDLPSGVVRLTRTPRLPPGRRLARVNVTLVVTGKDTP